MSLENLVSVVLSVEYLFGAATALAFRKQVSNLFKAVFDRASGEATADENEPLNGK